MVFSLKKLLKKKRGGDSDDASTEIQRSNKGKFIRGGKLSKKKSLRPNDHHDTLNSPLGTIEEKNGGTNKTVRPTPPPHVMTSVNVVETVDGGTELVFGDIPIMANEAPSFEEDEENDDDDEPDLVGEEDQYEDPGGVHVDELKKQLFANDYDDDDDDIVEPAPAVVVRQDEIPPIPDEPFDEPFDEKEMKKEDPYIMELMQTDEEAEQILQQQKEELQQQLQKEQQKEEQHQLQREAIAKVHVEQQQKSPEGLGGVAQNFMEVFACNADTTMFYDTICAEPQIKKRKRPYFNEEFAIEFIREATEDGISMLYHVPPSNPVDNDWTGQSMNMYILTGDCDEMMHPKFMWMTASGGYSRLAESSDVVSFAVGVLDVNSIMDSMEDENGNENEEDLVFFSITTNGGNVHLFECPTEEERNRLVAGIKNVIARMSFSIVAGDDVVLSELYTGDGEDEGELPPLRTPDQDMAGVSYQFLDSVAPGIVPKRNPSARVAL